MNVIKHVVTGSIADELGIEPGDKLVKINDVEIKDVIDYKYGIADDLITMMIEKKSGEIFLFDIEKYPDEDIGLEFIHPLMDQMKTCQNRCLFCFIDQLPANMRETLYLKDDDSRMSFLQGNFITMTNMSQEELDRIIRFHLGPVKISVHTTNPELRKKILRNKKAGDINRILDLLASAGIPMDGQIVLMPGINDGKELIRTINDLAAYHPAFSSLAVVPVGITRYRDGLFPLQTYDAVTAKQVIQLISKQQENLERKIGTKFVFLSDEFFALPVLELPNGAYYEGYPQLENGVGLLRSFLDEIEEALAKAKPVKGSQKKIAVVTGFLAYPYLKKACTSIQDRFPSSIIHVLKVKNEFFGETITVAGLLTGQDIARQFPKEERYDVILIPECMVKKDTDLFLDDMTISQLEVKLETKIVICGVDGFSFVKTILEREKS